MKFHSQKCQQLVFRIQRKRTDNESVIFKRISQATFDNQQKERKKKDKINVKKLK
jgi:hypothetical protein